MIDEKGFRAGVVVIIVNDKKEIFLARRIKQDAWQFPQGGLLKDETVKQAMYRELHEETGLTKKDVKILSVSKKWLYYYLPKRLIRYYSRPLCIGQKQKWFLLHFVGKEKNINFNLTDSPEFDGYKWVDYWQPLNEVISFKRKVYRKALQEFAPMLFSVKK